MQTHTTVCRPVSTVTCINTTTLSLQSKQVNPAMLCNLVFAMLVQVGIQDWVATRLVGTLEYLYCIIIVIIIIT